MPDAMSNRTRGMNEGPHGAHHIAPDVHGQNFYAIDRQFQDLMSLYMEPGLRAAMTPHFDRLGALAGGRLDELAMIADRNVPVLHPRGVFRIPLPAGLRFRGVRPNQNAGLPRPWPR